MISNMNHRCSQTPGNKNKLWQKIPLYYYAICCG